MFPRLYPIKAKLENKQCLTVESQRVANSPNHCNLSTTQAGCWLGDSSFCPSLLLLQVNATHLRQAIAYGHSCGHTLILQPVSLGRLVAFIMEGQLEE